MTQEFWIVIGLLAVVAIASIRLGYKWGRHAEYEKWTDEFIEDFKVTYLEKLTEAFQNKVEERAKQLAALMLAEKEIDNEDTHSS